MPRLDLCFVSFLKDSNDRGLFHEMREEETVMRVVALVKKLPPWVGSPTCGEALEAGPNNLRRLVRSVFARRNFCINYNSTRIADNLLCI